MDQNPDIDVLINVLKSYEIGEEISVGKADLRINTNKTDSNQYRLPDRTRRACHFSRSYNG